MMGNQVRFKDPLGALARRRNRMEWKPFVLFSLSLCVVGWVWGSDVNGSEVQSTREYVSPVVDVALQPGKDLKTNVLVGQVVGAQGQPVERREVKLLRGEKILAVAETDRNGYFAFSNVPGGLYRLQTSQTDAFCRVWASGSAPPGSYSGVVLVEGDEIYRGQILLPARTRLGRALRNPWVIGGIVAAAVAIPVAIAVADDDDETPPAPATP
jgi:hypothetical protein